MKKTEITVIIPAYNEQDSIAHTIQRIKKVSDTLDWTTEIIVVNDGSEDNTAKVALESNVRVINHPTNGGYGLSLQHGIEESSYDLIAITDADGTYPIEKLPELVSMVEFKNYDMAVGARSGKEYKKGLWKYPARIAFRLLAEYVAGRRIPDINSGLRVMKKEKLLPHYKKTCYGFSFTTSITLIFFLNGYFVGYTPIPYEKRIGKSKVKHFRDTLRTTQIMTSVIAFYNPIKLFLLVSIFDLIGSILLFALGVIFNSFIFYLASVLIFTLIPVIISMGFLAELLRLREN